MLPTQTNTKTRIKLGYPSIIQLTPVFGENGVPANVPPDTLPLDLDVLSYKFEVHHKATVPVAGTITGSVNCYSAAYAICAAVDWQMAHTCHYSDGKQMRISHLKAFYALGSPPKPHISEVGQAYVRPTFEGGWVLYCRSSLEPDKVVELTMNCQKPDNGDLEAAARHLTNSQRIEWV